jgi:hypothetical protein
MIGRIIRNNNGYEYVELEDPEILDTLRKISAINIGEFKSIYQRVRNIQGDLGTTFTKRQLVDISLAIYSNSTLKSFPVLKAVLASKISIIKESVKVAQAEQFDEQYETTKQLEGT